MLAALQAHSMALLGIGPSDTGNQAGESSSMAQRRAMASSDEDEDADEDDEDGMSDDGWVAEDGMVSDSEDEFGNGPGMSTCLLSLRSSNI